MQMWLKLYQRYMLVMASLISLKSPLLMQQVSSLCKTCLVRNISGLRDVGI